ncbi:MAG: methyltransferase domain-containing protein [Ktedonobacterales bacterium]
MRTRDATVRELLDGETLDDAALAHNLCDIRFINAFLGWTSYTVRAIERHVRAHDLRQFTLLDVASGSADMPLAIARWANGAGVGAHIVASDISTQIVTVARRQIEDSDLSNVTVERLDALALPHTPGSFDIVLCTLALHHFEPESAVALLRTMARVGRQVFVFDVVRSRLAYGGVIALTEALRMNYMTRHDAPVSVRRAYSASELRELAARAGLADARVWVGFPFRLALAASGAT